MSLLLCDLGAVTLGWRKDCCSHFSDEESEAQSTEERGGRGGGKRGWGRSPRLPWWGGTGVWVFWLLIHFSFGYAKAAAGFQMQWELLLTPGRYFLAKTSCLCSPSPLPRSVLLRPLEWLKGILRNLVFWLAPDLTHISFFKENSCISAQCGFW